MGAVNGGGTSSSRRCSIPVSGSPRKVGYRPPRARRDGEVRTSASSSARNWRTSPRSQSPAHHAAAGRNRAGARSQGGGARGGGRRDVLRLGVPRETGRGRDGLWAAQEGMLLHGGMGYTRRCRSRRSSATPRSSASTRAGAYPGEGTRKAPRPGKSLPSSHRAAPSSATPEQYPHRRRHPGRCRDLEDRLSDGSLTAKTPRTPRGKEKRKPFLLSSRISWRPWRLGGSFLLSARRWYGEIVCAV